MDKNKPIGDWIKVHRNIINHIVFDNEKALKIWLWCLLKANFKQGEVLLGRKKLTVNIGEFIFGSLKASAQLKIPKTTIWF
ncbi:hypothetical protein ISS03_03905 [Patescibacteria group bacterium]|nr:hypothetical protein [Patescibacteria group bacterium]